MGCSFYWIDNPSHSAQCKVHHGRIHRHSVSIHFVRIFLSNQGTYPWYKSKASLPLTGDTGRSRTDSQAEHRLPYSRAVNQTQRGLKFPKTPTNPDTNNQPSAESTSKRGPDQIPRLAFLVSRHIGLSKGQVPCFSHGHSCCVVNISVLQTVNSPCSLSIAVTDHLSKLVIFDPVSNLKLFKLV